MTPVTISRRSWHYRFASLVWSTPNREYEPRDLCSYFWYGLVLGVLFAMFVTVATVLAVGAIVVAVAFLFYKLATASPVAAVGLVLVLLLAGWAWYVQHRRAAGRDRPPNLVVAYLTAKKRKYCPRLELVS